MLPSSYLEKWGELDRTACTLRTLGGWALVAILVSSYCSVLLLHQTWWRGRDNLFIYQTRESSLVPVGFLTCQFLQKL